MKTHRLIHDMYKAALPRVLVARLLVRPVYKKSLTCTPRVLVRVIFDPLLIRPVYTL